MSDEPKKDGSVNDFGKNVQKSSGKDPIKKLFNSLDRKRSPKSEPEEEDLSKKFKKTQWSEGGHNLFVGVGNTRKKLKSGVYDIGFDGNSGQSTFSEKAISTDDLLDFPHSRSDKILNEMSDFWSRGKIFQDYGFLHRRGYLLYGPAGSGKTVLVHQVIKRIVDLEGIVFMCEDPETFSMGLNVVRQIEPERQIVCVFEDIDAIIDENGEDSLLSLLDGENQIDKVLNLATTNYPEDLDKRIIARPRRFDRVIKIDMPEEEVRRFYFSRKLKIDESELNKWVKVTKGFSFAAMAELVISVKCLGNSFDDSVEILKDLMETHKSSADYDTKKKVGFNTD